jgi:phage gp46-like protein
MATNIYSGDPYLTLGPDGSRLTYIGGQPIMDQGLENQALIALFTGEGWAGNYLFDDPNQQIGSRFVELARQPVTLKLLTDLEQEVARALASPAFGNVTAEATNPESDSIVVRILIEPPGQDQQTIILSRNGINWQAQANNPAHERVA